MQQENVLKDLKTLVTEFVNTSTEPRRPLTPDEVAKFNNYTNLPLVGGVLTARLVNFEVPRRGRHPNDAVNWLDVAYRLSVAWERPTTGVAGSAERSRGVACARVRVSVQGVSRE